LADRIEANRCKILDAYADGLKAVGSTLSENPEALAQVIDKADQVLSDVIESLRAGMVQVNGKAITCKIGDAPKMDQVHRNESLQAASVFFHATLSTAATILPPGPDSFKAFALIALTLESSIGLHTRQSLRAYTDFVLKRVEEERMDERRRVARELHDRLGHDLSVTQLQLELFDLYRDSDPAAAHTKFVTARQAIQDSMHNLRAITSDLSAFEPIGSLEKALTAYVETAETSGTRVVVHVSGDEGWAPPEVLEQTFLIIREASRNALRHAGASTVRVTVQIRPHELHASVEDDGCGFDTTRAGRRPVRSAGVGLRTMVERAELLGGEVVLTSRVGHGTQVRCAMPLRGQERAEAS
jgi:signal transduction histidine kinase